MAATNLTTAQVCSMLRAAPVRIADVTAGRAPETLRTAPGAGEWSATDVLAHLRSCGDVWGGWIARTIAEEWPAIRAVSPRTWVRKTDYHDLAFAPSFTAYAAQRADLLALLDPLPPEAWSRVAVLHARGTSTERTARSISESLATHEWLHVEQIVRLLATT